jgi:hypothetical protein
MPTTRHEILFDFCDEFGFLPRALWREILSRGFSAAKRDPPLKRSTIDNVMRPNSIAERVAARKYPKLKPLREADVEPLLIPLVELKSNNLPIPLRRSRWLSVLRANNCGIIGSVLPRTPQALCSSAPHHRAFIDGGMNTPAVKPIDPAIIRRLRERLSHHADVMQLLNWAEERIAARHKCKYDWQSLEIGSHLTFPPEVSINTARAAACNGGKRWGREFRVRRTDHGLIAVRIR